MSAVLTFEMGSTDKVVEYIEECRRLTLGWTGPRVIGVLPPDVNVSDQAISHRCMSPRRPAGGKSSRSKPKAPPVKGDDPVRPGSRAGRRRKGRRDDLRRTGKAHGPITPICTTFVSGSTCATVTQVGTHRRAHQVRRIQSSLKAQAALSCSQIARPRRRDGTADPERQADRSD